MGGSSTDNANPRCSDCQAPARREVVAGLLAAGAAAAVGTVLSGCSSKAARSAPTLRAGDSPKPALEVAKLSQIPVGGALIIQRSGVVVARGDNNRIWAFSATCTHAGCALSDVSGGTVNCGCHGSKFDIATGRPVSGPAKQPLEPVHVKIEGDRVVTA